MIPLHPSSCFLTLQGTAGIGIPGTAGPKGEEGQQVSLPFCCEISAKTPLECSVSPESSPVPLL